MAVTFIDPNSEKPPKGSIMCGRGLFTSRQEILKIYPIHYIGNRAIDDFESNVITANNEVPSITSSKEGLTLTKMIWGFEGIYNARSETAHAKNLWHNAYYHNRMIFPLDAFYENTWFTSKQPMAAAGIYRAAPIYTPWPDHFECSMLTTNSYGVVAENHPRIPVFVHMNEIDSWLSGELDVAELANRHEPLKIRRKKIRLYEEV